MGRRKIEIQPITVRQSLFLLVYFQPRASPEFSFSRLPRISAGVSIAFHIEIWLIIYSFTARKKPLCYIPQGKVHEATLI